MVKEQLFNKNDYYVSLFANEDLHLSLDTGKGLGKLPFLNLY